MTTTRLMYAFICSQSATRHSCFHITEYRVRAGQYEFWYVQRNEQCIDDVQSNALTPRLMVRCCRLVSPQENVVRVEMVNPSNVKRLDQLIKLVKKPPKPPISPLPGKKSATQLQDDYARALERMQLSKTDNSLSEAVQTPLPASSPGPNLSSCNDPADPDPANGHTTDGNSDRTDSTNVGANFLSGDHGPLIPSSVDVPQLPPQPPAPGSTTTALKLGANVKLKEAVHKMSPQRGGESRVCETAAGQLTMRKQMHEDLPGLTATSSVTFYK